MRFSEQFGITPGEDDDWFDPVLGQDTALALDPYLAFRDKDPRWSHVREKVFDFFRMADALSRRTSRREDPRKDLAAQFLRCQEPQEFCLGVATKTPEGHGTGHIIAADMLKALGRLAEANPETPVENLEVFRLFVPGIAFDMISDMVCTILKADLILYTQDVARRHDIPTTSVEMKQADWVAPGRWVREIVDLPLNAERSKDKGRDIGVLLVPKRWLRKLRRPDTDSFAHWTEYSEEAASLRSALNLDAYDELTRAEKTEKIRKVVWAHPSLAASWGIHDGQGIRDVYDVDEDPKRVVHYPENGMSLFRDSLGDVVNAEPGDDFCGWVGDLAASFVHTLEQRGGWRVLWEKGTGRHVLEDISQATANIFFRAHCEHKDVNVTRELDVGRGLVDFEFSRGQKHRALIEVKHMDNSKLVSGAGQLAQYLRSEKVDCGYLLCIGFVDSHFEASSRKGSRSRREVVIDACKAARLDGYNIKPVFVDARRPKSASTL